MDVNQSFELNRFMAEINQLVETGDIDGIQKKYSRLIWEERRGKIVIEKSMMGRIGLDYFSFLFNTQDYQQLFSMLEKLGKVASWYEDIKNEIELLLWEAFVEPNISAFKIMYERNIAYLQQNGTASSLIPFDELTYWLLPTGIENQFYMYDKKIKLVQAKVDMDDFQLMDDLWMESPFSDVLLIEQESWYNVLSYLKVVQQLDKKLYVVLKNINKFLSILQGVSSNEEALANLVLFDSFDAMDEYFKGNKMYLPRNIINLTDNSQTAQNYLQEIHLYRLQRKRTEGENNILLSICIPTYNRGHRAYENITQLLNSTFDEEVEFVISNNGTKNETEKDYQKIKQIKDARIKYFEFEENQGYALNVCQVCELAEGKYILLLSDEDMVDLVVLDEVMKVLQQCKGTLAILQTNTGEDGILVKKGTESIFHFIQGHNYVSGLIYNNHLLKECQGIKYIKENMNNSACTIYAHMVLGILISQYGDGMYLNSPLVLKGVAEELELENTAHLKQELVISTYSQIESRLAQFTGFVQVIQQMDVCQQDSILRKRMYYFQCWKTVYLIGLAYDVFYHQLNFDRRRMVLEAFAFCSSKQFTDIFFEDFEKDHLELFEYVSELLK